MGLTANLDAPKKYVYRPAAEVCGMVLNKLSTNVNKEDFEEFKDMVLEKLKLVMRKYGANDYKWLDCLHRVANHFLPLASDMATFFVYGLKRAGMPR